LIMEKSASTVRGARQHLPIYLDTLRIDSVLDFDLYIDNGSDVVLYRAAQLPFTERNRRQLLEYRVAMLYVSRLDQRAYQRYLEDNLETIVKDEGIEESVRAGIVYESAKFMVEDIFDRPTLSENIRRGKELVSSTVGFILTANSTLTNLLNVMSFNYSTYTHSVNVCTLSLALAQFIGVKSPRDLRVLGTGALLHDIGKTKIDNSILSKAGPLTETEMDIVRQHPQWGCDLAKETDLIDQESYMPILQHHERENKSGYPNAAGGKYIHLYGKITAIADVFDAMTTQRVYRDAVDAFPALKEMFDDLGAFDRELLGAFTKMLGPTDLDSSR